MEAHAADACVTLGRLTLELCGRVCKIECVCAGHVLGVTSVVKQASRYYFRSLLCGETLIPSQPDSALDAGKTTHRALYVTLRAKHSLFRW